MECGLIVGFGLQVKLNSVCTTCQPLSRPRKNTKRTTSSHDGYHPIQDRLTQYNGSQCGFCTPGMVMNMYSLLKESPTPTKQQIEDAYDGNICRCTGYRPILDAMKSFAVDADPKNGGKCIDIEDLAVKKCGSSCPKLCISAGQVSSTLWFRPNEVVDIFTVFSQYPDKNIKLITGDTGRGVFKNEPLPDVIVDLKTISSLASIRGDDKVLSVGATVSLNTLIATLESHKDSSPNSFPYLADHLKKIANVAVRNIGSWAGNLMLTHDHQNFPSDVFTIMEAAGATVTVASSSQSASHSLTDFLQLDMKNKVITSLVIPFSTSNTVMRTFKVMPRHQNAHAYVNAGFSWSVDSSTHKVQGSPSIVFGGLQAHAVHATKTEAFMVGKSLTNSATLQGALKVLQEELVATTVPPESSEAYRLNLSYGLFYKFYLASIPGHISDKVKSAAVPYVRPVSQSYQSYDTVKSEYPVTEPMTKLTAKLQASGEAQYVSDMIQPDQLSAAFVLATMGNATIKSVDATEALQIPGVMQFFSAKDIPGKNSFYGPPLLYAQFQHELLFVVDEVAYAGQPVGIIVADTQANADRAAKMVKIQYTSKGKPILTVADAIQNNSFYDFPGEAQILTVGDAKGAISNSAHTISGNISCGTQYHFHMETQTSLCIPEDDSYTVYSSTQWPDACQVAVSDVLGIQNNNVNVSVKRVGGGFGGKISRSHQIAAAAALAAHHTRRPVKIHMDIDSNMKMVGKRFPYYATYQAGFSGDGTINGVVMNIYGNSGCYSNGQAITLGMMFVDNAYHIPNWHVTPKLVKTNIAANTPCRSPGSLPVVFMIESIMEHIGDTLGMPSETIKQKNLYEKGQATPYGMSLNYCNIKDMWSQLYQSADVTNRSSQAADFNKQNHWRKRGISVVPLKWGAIWQDIGFFTVMISIYAGDGTVAVTHGGIEIGQGINTKVAQVTSKELGIPLDYVKILPTNVMTSPNGTATGGSTTSEVICQGVITVSQMLNSRIDPVRQKMNNPTWKDLITRCQTDGVDLSARTMVNLKTKDPFAYNIYGVNCTEVEIDVLTGEIEILRSDILFDCGQSINPEIDIGQVEGAYIMGLGYWLTEKCSYDEDSGEILTHNTWEYKPPECKDIPIDFRVELLKNAPNPVGILSSKACGEPPMCMSSSILFAVKKAIVAARADINNKDFFSLSAPATVEDIQQKCLVAPSQFTL
ncbi:xanthine dehydrogenase-like isoform X2 [Dysidea avara]|uniref:xanthine dehydrogenase-like isoform X2 n=1 Tax=Dysidea avara TaxID=196820 RepID=UPI0033322368